MLRWLGPRRAPESPPRASPPVTDDPLAAITNRHIYSVSRINPLFEEPPASSYKDPTKPLSVEKLSSSGYGGSSASLEPIYLEPSSEMKPRTLKKGKSSSTGSSGAGTLSTIPEGKVDPSIPRPIWPQYDSLVDDALLLYTSLNQPQAQDKPDHLDLSVKDLLVELLSSINLALENRSNLTPEELLKVMNQKLLVKLETLRLSTESEVKRLCENLSNCKTKNSVLRAFSHSSSSGHSSQLNSEWSSGSRIRTISSDTEELYQIPSGSSSSGFSDSVKEPQQALPIFVHEDLVSVPNGIRNAMIYGTLCRSKTERPLVDRNKLTAVPKRSLLVVRDSKPSVWEQYYGVKAAEEGAMQYKGKPSDIPMFPGGRPEADFTLDMPRSELLSKKMREDKKWRCRCRLLTSFLGLVFFLLSVMAVSLMLTRGKRMFGSMV